MEEYENGVTGSAADSETEPIETVQETESTDTAENAESTQSADNEQQQSEPEIPNNVWQISRQRSEREAQARIDREFAQRFKGYKNPKTGAEIKSKQDYFDALDAQAELARQRSLEQVTRNASAQQKQAIQQLLDNDPEKRRLSERVAEMERQQGEQRAQAAFDADFAALQKLDPSIKSVADLENVPNIETIVSLVQNNGLDMVTAYKAVNFDRAAQSSAAAGRQAAINAARGKNHLAAHGGTAGKGGQKVMTESRMRLARDFFPDKSDEEINRLYNNI